MTPEPSLKKETYSGAKINKDLTLPVIASSEFLAVEINYLKNLVDIAKLCAVGPEKTDFLKISKKILIFFEQNLY